MHPQMKDLDVLLCKVGLFLGHHMPCLMPDLGQDPSQVTDGLSKLHLTVVHTLHVLMYCQSLTCTPFSWQSNNHICYLNASSPGINDLSNLLTFMYTCMPRTSLSAQNAKQSNSNNNWQLTACQLLSIYCLSSDARGTQSRRN